MKYLTDLTKKYFIKSDGKYIPGPAIKRKIKFNFGDMRDGEFMSTIKRKHIILAQNIFIHYSPDEITPMIQNILPQLVVGGFFLWGIL